MRVQLNRNAVVSNFLLNTSLLLLGLPCNQFFLDILSDYTHIYNAMEHLDIMVTIVIKHLGMNQIS